MRLSGTNELIAIGAVVLVTVFMPQLVAPLIRSQVGKAVALAAVAWVALNVSQPLALLLAVMVVNCCSGGGWEHMAGSKCAGKGKADCKGDCTWDSEGSQCKNKSKLLNND
jgi:hypothetical protein